MGKTTNYAHRYRGRLIAAEVTEAGDPGYVSFAVPFMREYPRGHHVPHRGADVTRPRRRPTGGHGIEP